MRVERSQNVSIFLRDLIKVNQQKEVPIDDLRKFLKNNLGLVNRTELSPDLFVSLNKTLEALKTRISTQIPGGKSKAIMETFKNYNLFRGMKNDSKIVAALEKAKNDKLRLTHLDLSHKSKISDELIEKILELCPNLEYLAIGDPTKEDSAQSLKDIAKLKNLKVLKLEYLDIGDDFLEQVVSKITTLHSLSLSRCDDVTDNGIQHLSTLKSLEHLTVSDENITSQGCVALARKHPKLVEKNIFLEE